jgi:hypothetical protein
MKGNEGKGRKTPEQAQKAGPMMLAWCVQQARGGGYRHVEALIPASVVAEYQITAHPPDMRSIVAAKITQRLDRADIPPAWPREAK